MLFNEFMKLVDKEIDAFCGLDSRCIADFMYWDAWDDELSAKETARDALENDGYPSDLL